MDYVGAKHRIPTFLFVYMMNPKRLETAQQVLQIIPTVMRIVAAEVRRMNSPVALNQISVLSVLLQQKCNLSELAEYHAVSLPTMSNTVRTLAQRGLVTRSRLESDRRQLLIELTPAGTAVLQEIGLQVIARMADMLAPVSDAEQGALRVGLIALNRAFGGPEPQSPSGAELQEILQSLAIDSQPDESASD